MTDCRGEASTGVREEVECHKGREKEESEREGKKSELLASLFSSPSSSLSAPRPATGAALMAWHEEPNLARMAWLPAYASTVQPGRT